MKLLLKMLILLVVLSSTVRAQNLNEHLSVPDRKQPFDVTYKIIDSVKLDLTFRYPPNFKESKKYPAMIFFFGGGWNGGTPEQFNNEIILSGVYINFPVGTCKEAHFRITGDSNILQGGTFEDTYQNGMTEVTDFGSYNQNRRTLAKGLKGGANIVVSGNENTTIGMKMTARG